MAGSLTMLHSRRDFDRLQQGGQARAHRLIWVRARPNDMDRDRFGISTGRKVGGAVERNRVRRRIREALRHLPVTVGAGRDVLIVARPPCAAATYAELRDAIERLVGPVRIGEAVTGR